MVQMMCNIHHYFSYSITGFIFLPLQALPDNLKLLFRPVAMTTPEFGLIAEVFLYSVGFIKVTKIISVCAQLTLCYTVSGQEFIP